MSEIKEVENVTKEFEYKYQAVDENGRPLGAEQTFRGATVQEVLDKVALANKNLIKLNRELNKKIRLGEFEKDELPEDVKKITQNVLQPRELTVDEKAQFARDILDPEKFDEVNTKLIEAQFGAKPEDIRNQINNQERRLENIEAKQEAEAFVFSNSDYYVCPENFRSITSWMVKNNLKPVRENFQLAYDTLKAANVLLDAPLPEVPSVPPAPSVPAPPVEPVKVPEPVRAPSGLNRDVTSSVGTPQSFDKAAFRREVESMPSAEYKRRILTDKEFVKKVNDTYPSSK